MERNQLIDALRRMQVETGSLVCLGCGQEHNCGVHGCAIIREAVEALVDLETTHRTEMCESGYDCVELGKARKALGYAKAMAEVRAPLTLEQLREMHGRPVWVEFEDGSGGLWGIVHIAVFDQIIFANGLHCTIGMPYYGKTYKAYDCPQAHIDQAALCGEWQGEADGYADGNLVYDVWRCGDCGHVEETDDPDLLPRFCPSCGRAMTEDAWGVMKNRLRI